MEWYLVVDGVRRGPMSKAAVQTLIAKGVVKPSTPARRPDMTEWFPIGYIKEFNMAAPAADVPAAAKPAVGVEVPPPSPSPPQPPPASASVAPSATPQETPRPQNGESEKSSKPFLGNGYLGRHWRGEYSLPVSYWLNWSLLGVLLGKPAEIGIDRALSGSVVSDDPRPLFAGIIAIVLGLLLLGIWQMVGVARSALRVRRETGKALWPNLALLMVGLSTLAYAALTCLAATQLPGMVAMFFDDPCDQYRVELSADGKELNVSGRFDLGIAGQVRKALKQHPEIRTIVLDGDNGRASAGVALGSLLAQGHYTTVVRGLCASPCSTAFAGGSERLFEYGGRLVFHQPVAGDDNNAGDDELSGAIAGFLASRGLARDFVDKTMTVEGREQWAPSPRALFEAGVITAAMVGGQTVDAQAYPAAAQQAILDDIAGLAPFKALKALDASVFDASQLRLRQQLVADGSGDPAAPAFRHAVRRELHAAALRYLPLTSDAAAARYLRAQLDELRVLRNSDPETCRALIYPQFGNGGDPADSLTEETQAEYVAALEAVLVDAQSGDKRAPRDAQSAADKQQVLKGVLGRYPPVFSDGIGHPENFRALDALSICAFHIALREDLLALPAPRNGAALRRMTAEVLGP